MKTYLLGGMLFCALAGVAPALAQTPPPGAAPQREHRMMQPMTRAGVIEKVQQHFAMLDANKDGFVTQEEAQAAHMQKAGEGHSGAGSHGRMMGRMLGMADADKDGRVSLQEATAAATAHFDRADANHDGTLTPDEMRAAHQAMRGSTGG